jgi:Uma2 family endonuclease
MSSLSSGPSTLCSDLSTGNTGKTRVSSASVASPPRLVPDKRVVLPCVSWETYERLLADDEERRVPRITYDQGVLELVTPSTPHEEDALVFAHLVFIVAANLGTPIRSVGSTTFRRKDLERGFEPDASFYIQNEERIRGKRQIDRTVDPPPDVVLEMEMTRSALDKLPLFASMGIPEVWHCDGQRVTILILEQDRYRESSNSLALPALTSDILTRFLAESRTALSPNWFQAVSDWARGQRNAST